MFHSTNFFRGQLKFLLLSALSREAMHGYKLMEKIEEASMNLWKPGAGSLYPALEELKKEKLIIVKENTVSHGRKRKVYEITRLGRKKFRELQKKAARFQKDFLEMHKSKELEKYSHEDFLFLFEKMRELFSKQLSKYNSTLLELAMLSRQGKISSKQKKEFELALVDFLEKVEKINASAKK
ncbi:MAG TPA: PadR family transcriptional regulator [archaeon]|nr:PadR family transcriptional regulator [archaeon]